MSDFIIKPSKSLNGEILVPGDKSISHRAIMLGSLANGITNISGFLQAEDTLATVNAFVNMGVSIDLNGSDVSISGVGMGGLQSPKNVINVGNSGTSMRLIAGILAAQRFDSVLIGDASLSKRPMNRVVLPLLKMGAKISTTANGRPPLMISGGQHLVGINYQMPLASAQVKSSLLLAGLFAQGITTITEPSLSRNHTEKMLIGFGYRLSIDANQISLVGGGNLSAANIIVPADISSAAFFMVGACIAHNANINLKAVGINPTRAGIISILKLMGADITLTNQGEIGGELLADIVVKSSQLIGIEIPPNLVSIAIDEFPAIFIAASMASGQTVLTAAAELRVKESDRIVAMAEGLTKLGIKSEVLADGIIINGKDEFSPPSGVIQSHHDHRIAMAFALVSLRCSASICISGCENVATSFPDFVKTASQAGLSIKEV